MLWYITSLQVALPGKILVYELMTDSSQTPPASSSSSPTSTQHKGAGTGVGEGEGRGEYRMVQRLTNDVECSLLVVCDYHLILCQEKKLICLNLLGDKER